MKKQDENIQEGKSLDSFSRDVIHTNKMPQREKKKKKVEKREKIGWKWKWKLMETNGSQIIPFPLRWEARRERKIRC